MKRLPALTAFFSLLLLMAAAAAEPPNADQQILTAAREVQKQQVAIAENQAKIEAKVAAIAENLRVARIYSGRAGGK
ncbi:MAG TPA: hypothetical protein VGW39_17550 [Chthoniobacterales bacterium]|nr:hypothetical protein [Chthoniobacterales bacterium]